MKRQSNEFIKKSWSSERCRHHDKETIVWRGSDVREEVVLFYEPDKHYYVGVLIDFIAQKQSQLTRNEVYDYLQHLEPPRPFNLRDL